MSSEWTWAAHSPMPSWMTTPARCSPRSPRRPRRTIHAGSSTCSSCWPSNWASRCRTCSPVPTTSSLNALVTGNVPPVGFLTTKGHRDSIFIMNVEGRYLGRSPHELQNVLGQAKDHALLPKRHALEVTERVDRDGTVVVALDEEQARSAIRSLLGDGIRAIAVSLLWSFRNPAHERRLRELVAEQDPDVYVALSSKISPRIREFSRNATTIMSTQIGPGLRDYLTALEDTLRASRLAGPLLVMQSNGGAITAAEAPAAAISTIGSVLKI